MEQGGAQGRPPPVGSPAAGVGRGSRALGSCREGYGEVMTRVGSRGHWDASSCPHPLQEGSFLQLRLSSSLCPHSGEVQRASALGLGTQGGTFGANQWPSDPLCLDGEFCSWEPIGLLQNEEPGAMVPCGGCRALSSCAHSCQAWLVRWAGPGAWSVGWLRGVSRPGSPRPHPGPGCRWSLG